VLLTVLVTLHKTVTLFKSTSSLTLYIRRGDLVVRKCADVTPLTYMHTIAYYSRFISEGEPEASQINHRDTFYQNDLAIRNTADVTGGKPSDHSLS
jgi:hypothetical protein